MRTAVERTATIIFGLAVAAIASAPPVSAQSSEATVSRTEVQDSFFNPCTREVVDRSYSQHVTRRKAGDDYVLSVNWSNGRGVGQTTGDKYTMNWKYQQMSHSSEGDDRGQQSFAYRITTTVHAQGSASDYSSDILVRLRVSADGTVRVEKSEASGIECS